MSVDIPRSCTGSRQQFQSDAYLWEAVYKSSEAVGQYSASTPALSMRNRPDMGTKASYSTGKTDAKRRSRPGRKPRLFTADAARERNRRAQQAHRERKERLMGALQERLGQAEAQRDAWKQKAKAFEGLVSQLQEELRTRKDVLMEFKEQLANTNRGRAADMLDYLISKEIPSLGGADMVNAAKTMDANLVPSELQHLISEVNETLSHISHPGSLEVYSHPTPNASTFIETPESLSSLLASPSQIVTLDRSISPFSDIDYTQRINSGCPLDADLTLANSTNELVSPTSPDSTGQPPSFPFIPNFTIIRFIHLQLIIQSVYPAFTPKCLLPTPLQIAKVHDHRINYVIFPDLRDRILIFQDVLDLNHVFHLLRCEGRCWGAEPLVPTSWELPEQFFTKYWFLCCAPVVETTNRWRRRARKEAVVWDPLGSHVTPESIGLDKEVMDLIVRQVQALNIG
ncbi:hypothetical protein BZG36_00022 [Bifiguratus adelaidae]|uniref:BZIP domain-containing protein n=1 Tax=Bifiguratus adelaidae TaxID=1938954 RepID=A0A261Y8R6_9FUNG|nr:hypothetical protein BZG36_00022 [Bifiguratus adelaidae]